MQYRHRFQVRATLQAVADFHTQSASMAAITPPPVIIKVHQAPTLLREGDQMEFTMWLGPLPVHWLAKIEDVSIQGFTDRQVEGPFRSWVHRHKFFAKKDGVTEVFDEINIELKLHPLWFPVGLGMWLTLPVLFAYRAWKTRRFLEK